MSKYINHEEAYSYVSANYHTSNIARCYLNLREQRNDLLEALEEVSEFVDYLKEYNVPNDFPTDLPEKIKAAIAKAKGEL